MITILIVDDHSIVRQGLKSIIGAAHPEWEIAEAENGVQAILTAAKIRPDIILMDHQMPKLDGIKASAVISRALPASSIIMVTMSNLREVTRSALDAGIKRIVPKDAPHSEIISSIEEFVTSAKKISVREPRKMPVRESEQSKANLRPDRHNLSNAFTDREMDVLKLLVKGFPAKKIAGHLSISKRTVEGHKLNAMRKCDLNSTAELMRFLIVNKIVLP
jgi:DNA-binding NarL/FixJ family response regulator